MVIERGDAVARVLGGMDWALGLGARVLSLSLGFRGWWPDFLAITRVLRQKGLLPVFAVGNEYAGSSRSPGNYAEALSVGACGEDDRVADFSSSQRFDRKKDPVVPDLVAPGVGIVSARPGGGYQAMDGTSMATQHVAGLAALLLQAEPKARVSRLEKAILESCSLPRGMSRERGGRGIPSARKALEAL
jgi:subtilisin family serine protease